MPATVAASATRLDGSGFLAAAAALPAATIAGDAAAAALPAATIAGDAAAAALAAAAVTIAAVAAAATTFADNFAATARRVYQRPRPLLTVCRQYWQFWWQKPVCVPS